MKHYFKKNPTFSHFLKSTKMSAICPGSVWCVYKFDILNEDDPHKITYLWLSEDKLGNMVLSRKNAILAIPGL